MKKKFATLILIVCSIFLAGCFDDSSDPVQLSMPQNVRVETLDEGIYVLFDAVENADCYRIEVDQAGYLTTSNEYNIKSILKQNKNYRIKVKALSNSNFIDSEYSETITYSKIMTLAKPVLRLNETVLSWNTVDSASEYEIDLQTPDGQNLKIYTQGNNYNFSAQLKNAGEYRISVTAQNKSEFILDSEASEYVVYRHFSTLQSPSGLVAGKKGGEVWLGFIADKSSRNYFVKIDDQQFLITSAQLHNGAINLSEIYNFSQPKRYYISLSVSGNEFFKLSDETQIYFDNYLKLPAAVITNVSETADNYLIEWDCDYNGEYNVFINGAVFALNVNSKSLSVPKTDLTENSFNVNVMAKGYAMLLNSDLSQTYYYNCAPQLQTPANVNISQNIISFDAVQGAQNYILKIDETEFETDSTVVNLNSLIATAGEYTVKVKAVAGGFSPSDYSETKTFIKNEKLAGISAELDKNSLIIAGSANAYCYDLYIDNVKSDRVTAGTVDLTDYISSYGEYKIKVKAMPNPAGYYTESDFSNEITYSIGKKLSAVQNINVDNSSDLFTLSFTTVDFADYYEISVNSSDFYAYANEADISKYITGAGSFLIKIRACSFLSDFEKSDLSQFEYVHIVELSQINDLSVETEGQNYFINFTPIPDATNYVLKIYGVGECHINANGEDITNFLQVGLNTITLTPVANEYHISPLESEPLTIEKFVKLSVISNYSIKKQNDKIMLNWQSVDESTGYNIKINNQLKQIAYSEISLDLAQYLSGEGNYEISVQTVGGGYYLSSDYLSVSYKHKFENAYDYKRYKVFMYGENVSYYIENYESFEKVIWHQYLYRLNKIKICLGITVSQLSSEYNSKYSETGSHNVDNLAFYALCYYPEYVKSGTFDTLQTLKTENVYEIKFDNLITSDCTEQFDLEKYRVGYDLTDEEIEQIENETNPINHSAQQITDLNKRSDDFDGFKINEKEKVKVFNCEQLVMVSQYGMQPDIADAESVAYQVYNNAKIVLRNIVSDEMTNVQKVNAIFEWVQKQNVYDYEQITYGAIKGSTVDNLAHFSVYYLEGVLYNLNSSLAVCDGIAKTFMLLCRIEGIEAIKINGLAGGGRHAWNKVKIDGEWYMVDATWSDTKNSVLENVEIMSHDYFLVSDNDVKSSHEQEWPVKGSYAANNNYKYFEKTLFMNDLGIATNLSAANTVHLRSILKYLTKDFKEGRNSGYVIDFEVKDAQLYNEIQSVMQSISLPAHSYAYSAKVINGKYVVNMFSC